jgi:hypothetical protein
MICFHLRFVHPRRNQTIQTEVGKLERNKSDANHKIKMLRQQLRRVQDSKPIPAGVLDFSEIPCEEDGTTMNDLRRKIKLLEAQQCLEAERVDLLITGTGKGRGKSPELEFAARTILATGSSARAAKDTILVAAKLFLPPQKYEKFEQDVPSERWFRYQRKGLGYEAWLYSMLRVASCDTILQWGFDETRCSLIVTLTLKYICKDTKL